MEPSGNSPTNSALISSVCTIVVTIHHVAIDLSTSTKCSPARSVAKPGGRLRSVSSSVVSNSLATTSSTVSKCDVRCCASVVCVVVMCLFHVKDLENFSANIGAPIASSESKRSPRFWVGDEILSSELLQFFDELKLHR